MTDFSIKNMFEVKTRGKEDFAKAAIAFLECPFINKREISVYNACTPLIRHPGAELPVNLYYSCYDDKNIPAFEKVRNDLAKNDYLMSGVAAVDIRDKKRVGIAVRPPEAAGEKHTLYFVLYNDDTSDNTASEIIRYIEDAFEN